MWYYFTSSCQLLVKKSVISATTLMEMSSEPDILKANQIYQSLNLKKVLFTVYHTEVGVVEDSC